MVNISSLNKGLVAHYPLNGEYGTKDITPNANHGTNNGATLSTGRKGEANGSYSFDGVNDYIESNNIFSGNQQNFSVSLWAKAGEMTSDREGLLQISGPSSFSGGFVFNAMDDNTKLRIINWNDGGYSPIWTTTTEFFNGQWSHFIINVINNKLYIYENGYNLVVNNEPTGNFNFGSDIYIGLYSHENNYFNGSISDVRIYNRALSEDEIKLLYDSFKPEIATSDLNKGLVGHWMLDSENGAKDLTPNGNHGTAEGGITIGGTTDRKGKTGGATNFDGVDDYTYNNNNQIFLNGISYSMWVNPSSNHFKYGGILTTENHVTKNGSAIWFKDNKFYFGESHNSKQYTDGIIRTLNKWYYLTLTYNGSAYNFYVDGILTQTQNAITNYLNVKIYLGRLLTEYATEYFFNGYISDVRIYNLALSADEIKLLYDQYKPKEASVGSLNKGLVLDMPLTTKHMKVGNNNVTNGSFESDLATPPYRWVNDSSHTGTSVADATAPSGDNVCEIVATNSGYFGAGTGFFRQTSAYCPLTVGKTYKFSYWAKRISGGNSIKFGVQQLHDNVFVQTITDEWVKYTFTHTITTIYQSINFMSNSGAITFRIDDVVIKELKTSDKTPYGNDGTVNGATVGSEYTSFDGVNDVVEINDNTSLDMGTGGFTTSVWVKFSGELAKIQTFVGKYQSTPGWTFGKYSDSKAFFFFRDNVSQQLLRATTTTFALDTWYNVVITRVSSTDRRIYVNGQQETTNAVTSLGGTMDNNVKLIIGTFAPNKEYLNGSISNVKIWNRTLSEEEIKLLYEKGRY